MNVEPVPMKILAEFLTEQEALDYLANEAPEDALICLFFGKYQVIDPNGD